MQPLSFHTKEEFSLRPGTKKIITLFAVFLSAWVCGRFLLPLLAPFLLGALLALAAEPMTAFLTRCLRMPRSIGSALSVTAAFCFLALLVVLLGALALRELRSLAGVLPHMEQSVRTGVQQLHTLAQNLTTYAPVSLRPYVRENIDGFFADGASLLGTVTGPLLTSAGSLLSHVPDSALTLGTGLISAFLISAKLPRLRRTLLRRIPKERLKALLAALHRMKGALTGWLLAQAKLMGMTALLLLAGFLLLRIPGAPLWALGVAAVDAFPVLGTGTVLLPWSLLCLLRQDGARALGLLGLYLTVTLTRSVLEPKLVGRHLGLDPLATLMSLYIGYKLWGIGGMIAAPLLAVTALQLVPDRR